MNIQGAAGLMVQNLRGGTGDHKDSDLHSNPWSETFFCCGKDETKHIKEMARAGIVNKFIILSAAKMPREFLKVLMNLLCASLKLFVKSAIPPVFPRALDMPCAGDALPCILTQRHNFKHLV